MMEAREKASEPNVQLAARPDRPAKTERAGQPYAVFSVTLTTDEVRP